MTRRPPRSTPFPTRRSSDLRAHPDLAHEVDRGQHPDERVAERRRALDRKSTRLNSSHPSISYAVFCLKKKKCHSSYQRTVETLPSPLRRHERVQRPRFNLAL